MPTPAASKSPQDGLKYGQDGPKIAPRRLQDLPKTILKRFFLQLLFRLRFWSVFAPTWAPFPPPWGSQDDPKIAQDDPKINSKKRPKIMLPQDGLQDRSKTAQDGSKTAPDSPKGAPRPPRPPPGPPQMRPKRLQDRSKSIEVRPTHPTKNRLHPKGNPKSSRTTSDTIVYHISTTVTWHNPHAEHPCEGAAVLRPQGVLDPPPLAQHGVLRLPREDLLYTSDF